MENVFLTLFITVCGVIGLFIIVRLIGLIVPQVVFVTAELFWSLTDGISEIFSELRSGTYHALFGRAQHRSDEDRIRNILNEAANHGMPPKQARGGVNQKAVNASHA